MCVVLPLLLASALRLFCFIICRGHPEFMDFRRLLFDYEVSSFNVEIMCEIIWLVATISFLFISFLKTLCFTTIAFEGSLTHSHDFFLISKRVNETNDVESRSWQGGGRVDDTICSFIFHFGRIFDYGRPLTRPKGPWLVHGQRMHDRALFSHCSFCSISKLRPMDWMDIRDWWWFSPFGSLLFSYSDFNCVGNIHFWDSFLRETETMKRSLDDKKIGHQIRIFPLCLRSIGRALIT